MTQLPPDPEQPAFPSRPMPPPNPYPTSGQYVAQGQYPPPYPPAYPAYSAYGPAGYPMQPKTNSLATASLICSIVGIFICFPAAIAGIICGHKARAQIRRTGEAGSGLATAGLIIGYIWLALVVILIVILIIAVAATNSTTTT